MDSDRYFIATPGPEVEIKVKGSRFLGRVMQAPTMDVARDCLTAIVKHHHQATHHCWAARVGLPGRVESRSDDNGEPSGTAGAPILVHLERADWHQVLLVVTRYFGGTKLGTGGLAKAYGEAAGAAMEAAAPAERFLSRTLEVSVSFSDLGVVETLIAKNSTALLQVDREFGEASLFRLHLKQSRAEAFESAIVESTAGRARLVWD